LKAGNGEDFFARNGRWNFNNKVLLGYASFFLIAFDVFLYPYSSLTTLSVWFL
jgi:hypothetical protein